MIVRLSGLLAEVTDGTVIIEHDGIAREVLIPQYAIIELGALRGQQVTLHTLEFLEGNQASGNLVPRMLGFVHAIDREFFQRFVGVKGIGPRKALKALAEPVRKIASWIESGDAKAIARLPGIGPRGAELVVASLKGKVSDLALAGSGSEATGQSAQAALSNEQHDALTILMAWGDSRFDAERWLARAAELMPGLRTPDEWVRAAYRVRGGSAMEKAPS